MPDSLLDALAALDQPAHWVAWDDDSPGGYTQPEPATGGGSEPLVRLSEAEAAVVAWLAAPEQAERLADAIDSTLDGAGGCDPDRAARAGLAALSTPKEADQ